MEFLHDPETWIAVSFVAFLALAGRAIARIVNKGLDERGAKIRRDLEEARRLRSEAEALLAEYKKKQQDAAREAGDILQHAREEAELFRKEAATSLSGALGRRERMALDKITQAEAQAVAEVRSQAVDLAVSAAQRILEQQMAGPKAASLIDQSIAELDRKLH
ncbi:MAG TPA: F0F1 ATP synthase subunit B [Dongiaceae bacterium]|jgi:F-type H+-transporting ATPase subunit b